MQQKDLRQAMVVKTGKTTMGMEFNTEIPSLHEEIAHLSKRLAVVGSAWLAQYFSLRFHSVRETRDFSLCLHS